MQQLYMPRNLDDQFMVFFWSADELLPGFAVFVVGVLINQKLICLLIALLVTKFFRKMKEGHPDGFLLHALYWIGLIGDKQARTLPNPFKREYIS
ncbi:MAG: type IV conjugative transfer system protein TraL [Pseudomonadales bacterium]